MGGDDNLGFIAAALFDSPEGIAALAEAEGVIRKLPGIEWFNLLTGQVRESAANYKLKYGPVAYPQAQLSAQLA